MKRPAFWLVPGLALALSALPCRAGETATSPRFGVEVDVPEGFRWNQREQPRATTVIYLEGEPRDGLRPKVLVNHIKLGGVSQEDVFETTVGSITAPDLEHDVVELDSGTFLRLEFSYEDPGTDPPRSMRQRIYVTLRDQRLYQFVLSHLDAPSFRPLAETFDSVVKGARLFAPRAEATAQAEPREPAPARPEPETTQPEPAPARPEPSPARPEPETAQPEPAPARPEPAPARPEPAPARPEPAPAQPEPEPAPEGEPTADGPESSPEAAVTGGDDAPAPVPDPRATSSENLLAQASLVLFSSEYDPDIWAASHLTDGGAQRGWCSAPGSRGPHRFVFALPRPARLVRLVFDNDCPDEEGFEGVAAKGFRVEVSSLGPERGYAKVAEGTLQEGRNGQEVVIDTGEDEVQWLRLTVTGNHGHPTLTELMEVRAFGRGGGATTAGDLRFDRIRVSREKNGEALAEGQSFTPGERVWLNFKPRGLAANGDGKYWLEVDMVLEDDAGHVLLRRDKVVDHVAHLPVRPLSPFVALHLDLPDAFPAGDYVVRLIGRDRFAGTSAAAATEFRVGE